VHLGLGKHRHVLDFGLSQMGTVRRDKDHLGLSLSKRLHGVLVSQDGLSGLHGQLKATVHRVLLLFLHSQETSQETNKLAIMKGHNITEITKHGAPTVHGTDLIDKATQRQIC
jgi:hypothetical protein